MRLTIAAMTALLVYDAALIQAPAADADAVVATDASSRSASDSQASDADRNGLKFFEERIRPVLVKHCYECHAADSKEVKGGLVLDTRRGIRKGGDSGHAVVPGNLDESLLIQAVQFEDDFYNMPPKGKLPDDVVADFEKWVGMGAPDPRDGKPKLIQRKIDIEKGRQFWAFQSPQKSPAPDVTNESWPQTDVDRHIVARLEAANLKPAGDADRRTLIRRATFTLTGLPPTPEDTAEFVNDASPDAFEKVVDRLLDAPRFGERWGRHWLDVARYAESTGKERNYVYPYAWRYRNYVVDAFNHDKPYDEFVREQIAGDLLPSNGSEERNEHLVATGFLALGPKSLNERNREQFLMDVADEQIDVVGRAMLGVTVACARCHDHKFDPFPTTDYYAMAGVFRSTEVLAGVQGRNVRQSSDVNSLHQLASGDPELAKRRAEHERKQQVLKDELKEKQLESKKLIARLKRLPAAGNDKASGKNKGKAAKRKKKAAAASDPDAMPKTKSTAKPQPADAAAEKSKTVALRQRLQKQSRDLKSRIRELNAELKTLSKNAPPEGEKAMGVRDVRKPADQQVRIRGDVANRGPRVLRGFITVATWPGAATAIPTDQSGRLVLAEWMTARNNPLTARVMVNRIWHHLFGAGLVRTVDNFGKMGERPTHPELLDNLAVEFMEDGWSVKRAIKRIMLSRTWRTVSTFDEAAYEIDPDNRLLWRMSPRRMDAESIRDAMLAAAGRLSLERPKGSPMTELAGQEIGRNARLTDIRTNNRVRSVYLPMPRGGEPVGLTLFDLADSSMVVGRRDVTTVPLQALYMLNSPFVMNQAAFFGDRIEEAKGLDDAGRVQLAYELAFARKPTEAETARALVYLKKYHTAPPTVGEDVAEAEASARGNKRRAAQRRIAQERGRRNNAGPELDAWAILCQTLLASAEFRYVY